MLNAFGALVGKNFRTSALLTPRYIHTGTVFVTFTGQSGSGKNFRDEVLRKEFSDVQLIQSYTTRKLRPGGDQEYIQLDMEEFLLWRDQKKFAWWVQPHENLYGTLRSDVDAALRRFNPSTMHLEHSAVSKLLGHVSKRVNQQCVFRFYVTCHDLDLVKERIVKRDPSISKKELQSRLDGYLPKQDKDLASGLYHAVLDSTKNHSEAKVLEQMMERLVLPIPSFQAC